MGSRARWPTNVHACAAACLLGLASTGSAVAAPALLLRADFDGPQAGTALAGCLARATTGAPGFGERGGALRLRAGEECAFPAAERLNPRAGTLSFWAQPENWNDGEGRHQVLFEWQGRADGALFQLAVDSPAEAGVVRVLLVFGAWRDPRQQVFQITAPIEWRAGRWQKVDVTWDEHEVVVYGNGVAGERLALESFRLPSPADGRIRLTPRAGAGTASDGTALDELELWDLALPADRIAKRHRAALSPALAPAELRAPRSERALQPDGRLDAAEWARATRVPLLADAETGFAGLLVPHVAFAWSEAALHVALEAPLTDPADAFELTLAPAGSAASRSFRVTPAGLAGGDGERAPQVEAAAQRETDAWTAELAIPWQALGVSARDDAELALELRHRPAAPGALAVGARLAGAIRLGAESEGVRVTAAPDLALGRLAVTLERAAEAQAELSLSANGRRARRERETIAGRRELALDGDATHGVLGLRVADEGGEGSTLVDLETRVAPLDAPGLLPVPESRNRALAVEVDLGWLDGRWRNALAAGRASARLADRGPQGEEGPLALAFADGRGRVRLSGGLAPGLHRLVLELASGDEVLRFERAVAVPELPWLGTQLGVSDAVLEPWLPLAWDDDDSVRVWGRRYAFSGALLREVEGRGGPMLRRPMEVRLKSESGLSTLVTTTSAVRERRPARAELRGTGSFAAAGIDVGWSTSIEYDGLVLTTLTLTPTRASTRVDELVLELPLAGRYAKYLRGTREGSMLRRGRVPWDGRLFESRFEPFLWLTDEQEGFLWFSESSANWVGAEQRGAVAVRGGSEAGITLRLIGEPTVLPGPLTYTFGFQATPVKPLLPDARAWNFGVGGSPTSHERAIGHFDGFAVADGLWELQRPAAVADVDRALARQRGVRPFYYGLASATADFHPVFRLFAPLWRSAWSVAYPGGARPATALREAMPPHRVVAVCPVDPDWQDRMLFDADRLLRATGALGLYTDTDEVFADDNPRHGCGGVDAFGRRVAHFGILGKRRFAKRLATLLRSVGGGRRYWMSHAHTRLVPPVTGFADFWLPGEELTGQVARKPWLYVDGLDELAWRVEYRGESSGIVHVLLPQLERGAGRAAVEDPAYTEGLLAMAAVNDVNVSSAFTNLKATGEAWGLRERLGLVGAEFTGHWRPDCPVRALLPDARASLYRTEERAVLVVASRAPVPRDVEVQLDLAALGLPPDFVAKDERSGRTLARRADRVTVPLGPRSYTYVSLR